LCDPSGEDSDMFDGLKNRINIELEKNNSKSKVEIKMVYDFPKGSFDILFFDYGGLEFFNRSQFIDGCRKFVQHAYEHPNRFYVLYSNITQWAVEDLIDNIGKE